MALLVRCNCGKVFKSLPALVKHLDKCSANPKKVCKLCGCIFEDGVTIWPCGPYYVHPECIEGRPIDHGD